MKKTFLLFCMGLFLPGFAPADVAPQALICHLSFKDLHSNELISIVKPLYQPRNPFLENGESIAETANFRITVAYYPDEADLRVLSKDQNLKVESSENGAILRQANPASHQEATENGVVLTSVFYQSEKANQLGLDLRAEDSTRSYWMDLDCSNHRQIN